MADISKINAVALANIAKLDAVLAANIAKVNGLVFTAAAGEFLLDTYTGAAAGYSVRRLATSATVLLRVRRDTAGGTGDDDEADVAYDSNNILSLDSAISNASVGVTATTLGQFLNVGTVNGTTYTNPDSLTVTASCYVDTWYDQAGSNDAEQATEANQPQIHDGTVNTDLITENGKPAVNFATNHLLLPNAVWNKGDYSLFMVTLSDSNSNQFYNLSPDFATDWSLTTAMTVNNEIAVRLWSNTISVDTDSGAYTLGEQILLSSLSDISTSTIEGYIDSVAMTGNTAAQGNLDNMIIGAGNELNERALDGVVQEFVFFSDYKNSTDQSAINTNINSEYLIYQPTDQPTSGFLYTYGSQSGGTDAAAAYSVRQLSDKAVIAMRIRRDSDDEETNIGWDSNGDLDTTAISDFCQTANGYVTRWWDQSTNGNHADQATDASQPQIYNGTAVITENGKPAMTVADTNDVLLMSATGSGSLSLFAAGYFSMDNAWVFQADKNLDSPDGIALTLDSTSSGTVSFYRGDYTSQNLTAVSAGQHLASNIFISGTGSTLGLDGATASQDTTTLGTTAWNVSGESNIFTQFSSGTIRAQEFVLYYADQSSNRTGIETNINTYFSIY